MRNTSVRNVREKKSPRDRRFTIMAVTRLEYAKMRKTWHKTTEEWTLPSSGDAQATATWRWKTLFLGIRLNSWDEIEFLCWICSGNLYCVWSVDFRFRLPNKQRPRDAIGSRLRARRPRTRNDIEAIVLNGPKYSATSAHVRRQLTQREQQQKVRNVFINSSVAAKIALNEANDADNTISK